METWARGGLEDLLLPGFFVTLWAGQVAGATEMH